MATFNSEPPPQLFSVVVCTYNRVDLLAGCLQSLGKQTFSSDRYEILVVDNNSTDDTKNIATQFCDQQTNAQYLLESQVGLSYARNRGMQVAKGKYLAYIDDDCIAPESWLQNAEQIVESHRPAIFGGPYFAFYRSEKPIWYKDEYRSHVQGDSPRPLAPDEFLDGCNFFIHRDMAKCLGGFNVNLGMIADQLGYGEETAITQQMRTQFPESPIYYHPELKVYHFAPPDRMRLTWKLRQSFVDGRSWLKTFEGNPAAQKLWLESPRMSSLMVLRLFVMLGQGTVLTLLRDRDRYPHWQNYYYEQVLPQLGGLGLIYEKLRVMFRYDTHA